MKFGMKESPIFVILVSSEVSVISLLIMKMWENLTLNQMKGSFWATLHQVGHIRHTT